MSNAFYCNDVLGQGHQVTTTVSLVTPFPLLGVDKSGGTRLKMILLSFEEKERVHMTRESHTWNASLENQLKYFRSDILYNTLSLFGKSRCFIFFVSVHDSEQTKMPRK